MSPLLGWVLAAMAVAAGYAGDGWRGVVLALSVVVFWLLLQFSRALRVMRRAAARPLGTVDSAVMLSARLQPGMKLMQVLALTRSLGLKAAGASETWIWTDAGGDIVRVELRAGRIARVSLVRAAAPA